LNSIKHLYLINITVEVVQQYFLYCFALEKKN